MRGTATISHAQRLRRYVARATIILDRQLYGRCLCETCRPGLIELSAWRVYWAKMKKRALIRTRARSLRRRRGWIR